MTDLLREKRMEELDELRNANLVPVSLWPERRELAVSLCFEFPPIPTRSMDWSAVDDNTYDCSYEGEDETGHHWKSEPVGRGATAQEALVDLLWQMEA